MTKKSQYVSIVFVAFILAVSMTINVVIGTQFHTVPFMPRCEEWGGKMPERIALPFHPEFNRAAIDTYQHCFDGPFAQKHKDGELHLPRSFVRHRDNRMMDTDEIVNVFLFAAERSPWQAPHNCNTRLPELRGHYGPFISCGAIRTMARHGKKVAPKKGSFSDY